MKTSTAAAGVAATIGGSIMGIPLDALIAGLFGGFAALIALPPPPSRPKRHGWKLYLSLAGSMALSVILAGFLGPWAAGWLDAPNIHDRTEMFGACFLVGAGAQAGLLLTAIEALRRRIDQLGGSS